MRHCLFFWARCTSAGGCPCASNGVMQEAEHARPVQLNVVLLSQYLAQMMCENLRRGNQFLQYRDVGRKHGEPQTFLASSNVGREFKLHEVWFF